MLIPNILETSSCLHVTLLVFLRLLAVSKPLTYKNIHKQVRVKAIVVIWVLSIFVRLLSIVAQLSTGNFYFHYRNILLHMFHTIPMICIVFMNLSTVWIVRNKVKEISSDTNLNRKDDYVDEKNRRLTLMVKRIVICLLICYTPYLIWWQYYNIISIEKRTWTPTKLEVIYN